MLTVLIVDDDEEIRNKAMRALANSHIRLASAANGKLALEQAALLKPDIVICDVDMPDIGGFDVLAALKADGAYPTLQVMMLTGMKSRNAMRLGMSLGADDYLTKPFSDIELMEAVDGLIKRRARLEILKDSAVRGAQEPSSAGGGARGEDGAPEDTVAFQNLERPGTADAPVFSNAAVLFADIRGFTSIAEKLSAQDVAKLLTEYFERACEPILAHGGQYLKLMGDGLMTVFPSDPGYPASSAHRALVAASEIASIAGDVANWVSLTFPDARLPPFRVGFGVHCGEIALTQMNTAPGQAPMPIGDTVNIAARLEGASKELGWVIVASEAVTGQLGSAIELGGTAAIAVRGREGSINVSEVLRVAALPVTSDGVPTMRWGRDDARLLHANARRHAGKAARAAKNALGERLAALRRSDFSDGDRLVALRGFEILRRLGAGGMSTIYLARDESTSDLVVLKVLSLDANSPELTARFMREFALLSTLRHPHIVRIRNQGFTDDSAYIVMEYFENGDLRGRMQGPVTPQRAAEVVRQVAQALSVVHAMGIVHRDLKPENLMVRSNGEVVLADFGIAKSTGHAAADQPTLTMHGEMVGSPSYMSPEQVFGDSVSTRSDLYSLGIILYELLAGTRPFTGRSLVDVLAQHANQPAPKLPAGCESLQPIVDRLLAKKPMDRYQTADDLLRALDGVMQVH